MTSCNRADLCQKISGDGMGHELHVMVGWVMKSTPWWERVNSASASDLRLELQFRTKQQ